MRPPSTRGMMAVATMGFAACAALVGIASWAESGLWWGSIMALAVGGIAALAAAEAWRIPSRAAPVVVLVSLLAAAAVGVGVGPFVRGLIALGEGSLRDPTAALTRVLLGIAGAIYLAFSITSLVGAYRARRTRTPPSGAERAEARGTA